MPKLHKQGPLRVSKRGAGFVVPINVEMMKALGWNGNDFVHPEIIRGSLVLTKITLPKALGAIQELKANGTQSR
jgi:hypothetical protein